MRVSLRVAIALGVASITACASFGRFSPRGIGARRLCRPEDGLVESAREWLSLPSGPADTIGKQPGFFAGVPGLPARDIITVVDERVCREVALALARSRGDTAAVAVSVLRFGQTRYVAWDLVEKPGARPTIFLTYYVLNDRFEVLEVVPT